MRSKKTSWPLLITTLLAILTFSEIFLGRSSSAAAQETVQESAQQPVPLPTSGTKPGFNFRPIGTSSQVDQFQQPNQTDRVSQRSSGSAGAIGSGVQQTAFRQDGNNNFSLPGANSNDFAAPVASREAAPVNSTTPPSLGTGSTVRGQTSGPRSRQNGGLQPPPASASDLNAVPRPTINQQWSSTGNSPLVTGPSGYPTAGFDYCDPRMTYSRSTGPIAMLPTGGQPCAVVPPTVPPNSPQAMAVYPTGQTSIGPSPLFTLGQERYNVQLGQGIIGQPVAYVPGQYFRNFLRYLAP